LVCATQTADEESKAVAAGSIFADLLQTAAQTSRKSLKFARPRPDFYPDDDAEHNERDERARLRRCENILNKLARLKPRRVHVM